jgi:hypothetical protein
MSYSFSATGDTKAQAKAAVAAEFLKVVEQQPIHKRDMGAALVNAFAAVDLLSDEAPEGCIITVSCSGYVGWLDALRDDVSNRLSAASISASASYGKP